MNPDLLKISKTRYTWANTTRNVTSTPLRYFYPRHVEDIQEIVKEAEKFNLRVRAVGSGHSFSEAAKGDDFVMDMKELRNAGHYEYPWVKNSLAHHHYVIADAGITIRRINRLLDAMGLALFNMGAVDFQTISGALSTGTHGTGIHKPAFPDMVRALRLVGRNGKLIQIEPADGITDPVYHQAHSTLQLIQDDDVFYSTVLSFGGMGIIYQIVFEVTPKFWIQEHRYLERWSTVKPKLLDGSFMQEVENHDFMAFRVNPYKIKGDHLCSIVQQNINHDEPSYIRQGGRNILSAFFSNREAVVEATIRAVNRKPQKTGNKIQTSLKFSRVRKYTDKSFKVLYQSGAAVLRYGISSEFAFEAKGDKMVEVLEKIFEVTAFNAATYGRYHPSHIAFRFVMPSMAYLSSAHQRPTTYIDVPTLYGALAYQDLLEDYQKMLIGMGGIPHWGKVNNMLYLNHAFLQQSYPKMQDWINVRRQMDPDGTFLSDFIVKMGLE
ncbi:MAG TPA: FAD-binding protein [Saprospiraceae bacterium]|nr:FAD-binding protein [Saprospiraceae bacterium]